MISNFHTHTYLCKHAVGEPKDYVKKAAEEGCSALGFSDHCPYPDSSWEDCRMGLSDVAVYRKMFEQAKSSAPFPIFFGFECEWLPHFKNWYSDYLKHELNADYLVFGSHWLPVDGYLKYVPDLSSKREVFNYIDFTIEGMETGIYSFLAHPDLFLSRVENIDADYEACCKALINAAIALNMPIEINGYGLLKEHIVRNGRKETIYPVSRFWELAKDAGAIIICSSDAHFPEHTIFACKKAFEFARSIGIEPQDAYKTLGLGA